MRRLLLLALLALVPGCGGCDTEKASKVAPVEPNEATLRLLDAAGAQAPLVVLLHPGRWADLHGALAKLAAGLPTEAQLALGGVSELDALLALGFRALGAPPPDLAAWDRSRPVVLALGEPPVVGPPGAVTVQASASPLHPAALRHRVVLPATDAAALSAAIAASADAAGKPDAALGAERAWRFRDTLAMAVQPGDGHVTVVLWTHGAGGRLEAPAPPPRTPSLLAAAAGDAAVAVLARPTHLRAWSSWHSSRMIALALAGASTDLADRLQLAGQAELLKGELLMDDGLADFDEHLAALHVTDAGLGLRLVSSLTPDAAAALAAAASNGVAPPAVTAERPLAQAWTTLDLRKLVDTAAPPGWLGELEPRALMDAFRGCGSGCLLQVLLRSPIDGLSVAERVARRAGTPLDALPRSTQAVLTGLDERGRPRLGWAARLPGEPPAGLLRALTGGPLRRLKPEALTVPRGDERVLLLGFGADPRAIFDADADAPARDLAGLRVDFGAFAQAVAAQAPEAAAGLGALGELTGRFRLSGRALVGEVHLTRRDAAAPALPPLGFEGVEWPSATGATPADACLRRTGFAVATLMEALAHADPAVGGRLAGADLTSLDADVECAAQDATRRELAFALRRMVVLPVADGLARGWQADAAAAVLEPLCRAGDAAACAWQTAIREAPKPTLPVAPLPCQDHEVLHAHARVLVDAAGDTHIEGQRFAGDPAALVEALRQRVPTRADWELPGDEPRGHAELAVDAAASWGRVVPVLDALRAARYARVALVVARPEGAPGWAWADLATPDAPERPVPEGAVVRRRQAVAPGDPVVAMDGATIRVGAVAGPQATVETADPEALREHLRALHPDEHIHLVPTDATPAGQVARLVAALCPAVSLTPPSTFPPLAAPLAERALRPVEILDGLAPGKRRPQDISAVVKRHAGAVKTCYNQALARQPDLVGAMHVRFTIAPDGSVSRAEARSETFPRETAACVEEAMRLMRFPAGDESIEVTYPFNFTAQ